MATESHLTTGDEIAGYTLESLVGRGGMGEVFRAVDGHLARAVALKVLAPGLVHDEASRDRILRESQLAASLDHPNVIPVYAAGEADGHVYIAMRLVEGSDLRTALRRDGRLEPARAIALVAQVASALDAAHARGLVHRDVKPSNVLIDEQQEREHCYLADFGITTTASDLQPVDVSQRLLGTLAYVAPEQVRGDPVDARADVYSLGCLLFECLTGEVPFVRDSDIAVVFAHLEEPPPRPSERVGELPPELDAVIARALAKQPADRYPTCGELVDDARRALALEEPRRSRRGVALALLIAVLAVAGAAIAVAVRSGSAPAPAPTGSIVRIDPASGAVRASYRLSAHPAAVAIGPQIWVTDYRQGTLWRIDPAHRRVRTAFRPSAIRAPPRSSAGSCTSAVTARRPAGGNVTRYDALTGSRIDSVDVMPCSVAAGDGVAYASGCPNVNRISTGPGKLRRVHRDGHPACRRRRRPSTANDALRAGRRGGRGLGDRRRARPPSLQDRAALGPPCSRYPAADRSAADRRR